MKNCLTLFACLLLSVELYAGNCLVRESERHKIADFRAPDPDGVWIVNTFNPVCTAKHCEVLVGDKVFFDQASSTLTWQKSSDSEIRFKNAKIVELEPNGAKLKILKASDRNYDVYLFYQDTSSLACPTKGTMGKDGCHIYQFEVFPIGVSGYLRPDDFWAKLETCFFVMQPGSGQGIDPPKPPRP
jgi:hypothetical protein